MSSTFDSRELVAALKAAAEPTRLRVLRLLATGELNVKDLTEVLGQSQPRLSRHLKLLAEAGLVERIREGSWVYFYVPDRTVGGKLARTILDMLDGADSVVARDSERASVLKQRREAAAQEYFKCHAADWDRIRALHVSEQAVEAAMRDMVGAGPFRLLVDLGTGTGRILELFADRYSQAIGFDMSHAMLSYARSNLGRARLDRAQVRHGDLYNIALPDGSADAVVMHQVLHYLSDPSRAISEAARVLAPGGKLLIVDFAPHELEFLRETHAHERLGFPSALVEEWLAAAGFEPTGERILAPTDNAAPEGALTVSLWLATRPGKAAEVGARTSAKRKLEEAR